MNERTNRTKIPFMVIMISVMVMALSFFLPYNTAVGDRKEKLEENEDKVFIKDLDMKYKDAKNMSVFEYLRVFALAQKEDGDEDSMFFIVVISLVMIFTVITAIFGGLKKAVPTFIFNLINLGAFSFMNLAFKAERIVRKNNYTWGVAYYFFCIAIVAIFVGAVWLFVAKVKDKKEIQS